MSLKSQIEAIIYAAEEPVTLEELLTVLKDHVVAPAPPEGEPAPAPLEPKAAVRAALDELIADYAAQDRGMEIREVAGGYRMSTKPEHHDVVRALAKSLKPPIRLSLAALETLSVIAYKQPITAPEISEIRGVDTSGVLATLLDRKLITTAGRKAVVGRPILYRTTKEFLLRFGLKDVSELPSLEEFEKIVSGSTQEELFAPAAPSAEATDSRSEESSDEVAEPEQPATAGE
jgi:segregation and condensation protein B